MIRRYKVVQTIPREEIDSLLNAYPKNRRYALAVMQDIQRRYNYVPREALTELAKYLSCPLSELYSMASFYKALSLEPRGKHIIKVCDGTACHIRGSTNLIDGICRILEIEPDGTTEDGLFSLELVNCIGACALAPVMVIDENYYGNVKTESLKEIFEAVKKGVAP
jgi:NADH-quinone oxidoreductase subunit E